MRCRFFGACSSGNEINVAYVLKFCPSLVHETRYFEDTGLCLAVEHNNLEVVRLLAQAGSDVNHHSNRLGFPIVHAAYHGNAEMVAELLDAGAAPHRLPLSTGVITFDGTALHAAAGSKKPDNIQLLLERGMNPNSLTLSGAFTSLHSLAGSQGGLAKDEMPVIELLMKFGTDVNARDSEGHTPLYYAQKNTG